MAIVAGDLELRLSTKAGSAGDTTAQGDPDAALGKYASTTVMGTGLHGLFDPIDGDENAASDVEYRCVFLLNDHATLDLQTAKVWVSSQVAGGADVAIGLDSAGIVPKGQAGAQATEIATEGNAPVGVSFSTPTTKAGGLSVGDLGPGEVIGIWIRRTANDTGAVDADGFTLAYGGDTAA